MDIYLYVIHSSHRNMSAGLKKGYLEQGEESHHEMCCGGILFLDHGSINIDVFHQVS